MDESALAVCPRKIPADNDMRIIDNRINILKIFQRNKYSIGRVRESIEKLPIKLTIENIGILTISLATTMPRYLTHNLVYPIFRLVFGTLYPAYASYKAVRTKNVKEYVSFLVLLSFKMRFYNQFISSFVAGQMDDVLDRLCAVHVRRDIHRRLPELLVRITITLCYVTRLDHVYAAFRK